MARARRKAIGKYMTKSLSNAILSRIALHHSTDYNYWIMEHEVLAYPVFAYLMKTIGTTATLTVAVLALSFSAGCAPVGGLGSAPAASGAASSLIPPIATAAEDCEITTAQYAYWGKVAMLRLVIKKTTAVSSGTTTLCTIVEGKRPRYNAMGQSVYNNGAYIGSDGTVKVSGAISAGASLTICSTYILA